MKTTVLHPQALERIKHIHALSEQYNGKSGEGHTEKLLSLMKQHVEEIHELISKENPHYGVEAGDLAVLCFEMLLEKRFSVDEILLMCFDRYEKKLGKLLEGVN